MQQLNATEISSLIKKQIEALKLDTKVAEEGTIVNLKDGIAGTSFGK